MSMGGLGGAAPTGFNAMNLGKEGPLQAPRLPGQMPSMPVAPQQNVQFENRAQNQRGNMGINQQARPLMSPVAPVGMGPGVTTGPLNRQTSQSQSRYNSGMRW